MNNIQIKKFKKFFINESGGINDNLKNIINGIINLINKDCKTKKKYISNVYNIPYVENNEGIVYDAILNENKTVTFKVKYTLYYAENNEERKSLLKLTNINFNSSWDEKDKIMTIVDIVVNEKYTNDFYQTVEHEVEHMYEYAMGLKKDEDLYEKTVKLIQNKDNIYSHYVGAAFYYTFKHEQEAFKQQFYIYLTQLNKEISFDNALDSYTPFKQMNNMYDAVYDNEDNENLMKFINELGYSRRDYFKRLYNQYNRFIAKLKQAYNRWWLDNKDKFLTQEEKIIIGINMLSRQMILSEGDNFKEKEKNILNYKTEFYL